LGHAVKGYDIKNNFIEDIRNESYLESVFDSFRPEIVIHLAARAMVRQSADAPHEYTSTNIDGTYNLLRLANKYGVKRFLSASSSSVYGETPDVLLKEDMACKDLKSIYAITKKTSEDLCQMFSGKMKVFVFRPFPVYGENSRSDMAIGKLLNIVKSNGEFHKYGKGDSVRGYTNVHDLVDGIVKLMKFKADNNFDVFNLGGSEKISLNRLLEIVKDVCPNLKIVQEKENPYDVFSSCADISKAKQVLNWEPVRNFEEEIIKLFTCQQV
jgi:UDP-glucuronate 4-epimerase